MIRKHFAFVLLSLLLSVSLTGCSTGVEMGKGIKAFYCRILTFYVGINSEILERSGYARSAFDSTQQQKHDSSTSGAIRL